MATSSFLAQTQPQQYRASASLALSAHTLSNGANNPIGTPFASAPSPACRVLISRLPADTTEEQLRLMLTLIQGEFDVEMLSPSAEASPSTALRSAIVKFESAEDAERAQKGLHGRRMAKNASDTESLVVEILSGSPPNSTKRYPEVTSMPQASAPSSASSSTANSRQPSRLNDFTSSIDNLTTATNGLARSNEFPNPNTNSHYQDIFSPQSPIGNHIADRSRGSGKSLIRETAEDDETSDLLQNTLAFAEQPAATQQRRATAPQLPIAQMGGLSLNTTPNGLNAHANGPASLPPYGHHSNMTPLSAHGNSMSPTLMNGTGHGGFYSGSNVQYPRYVHPPVNPADMNPPCNTLYVGNLPLETSEEELKQIFTQQRGYKRLCFRAKANGPMCFVEFEDTTCATRTLHELYGKTLYNSQKGGIRLSFSKNPLGVRSGQTAGPPMPNGTMGSMNGIMAATTNGFAGANGPPPGLTAPPGLGRAPAYSPNTPSYSNGVGNGVAVSPYINGRTHVWGNAPYGQSISENGPSPTSNHSAYAPPHTYGNPNQYASRGSFAGNSPAASYHYPK